MPRPPLRTATTTALLLVPVVAGGFFLQGTPSKANATLFEQVRLLVTHQYVDSLGEQQVYEKSAAGLVRELHDPYSELFQPKQSEDFNRTMNGRYGGTGMLIGQESQSGPTVVTVVQVFPNTPAEQGGVMEGDHVMSVDDTLTAGLTLDKVSNMLRGPVGSTVNVVYARPGVVEPIKLHFTRREVHVPAVQVAAMLGDHVGYVDLQTFNENAADEVHAAVEKLRGDGAKGIVLDMRENGGGIVDQSLAVASLFLHEGQPIVSVRARNTPTETAAAHGEHLTTEVPLVVLVDSNSASATEIVAGALQDHDRALVVGTNTYGKGLVQSLYQLSGGYDLKLTTGKWYTPSGRSIHRERKMLPDGRYVEVPPDSASAATKAAFRSDEGRPLDGGGGIHPDLVVAQDTLTTLERDFYRAVAPKGQLIRTTTQDYALQLKSSVTRDFKPTPAWSTELLRRLTSAGVSIDPKYSAVATKELTRNLELTVARLAFGDAAVKARSIDDDRQLTSAIGLLEHSTSQAQLFAAAGPAKK